MHFLTGKTEHFLKVLGIEVKMLPVLGTFIFRLQGGSENVLLWFIGDFPGRFY
jgi:hypothetical protein